MMTVVIGLIDNGAVYMGCDSASVGGWKINTSSINKVFARGEFLLGFSGSWRMGQILEHALPIYEHPDAMPDMTYMVNIFIESVRKILKERGFSKIENNNESGGRFLVGYRGKLYSIDNDFQVNIPAEGFDACGCGDSYALGAMLALSDTEPVARIYKALEVSEKFCMGVRGPFTVMVIPSPDSVEIIIP
jgi:ATP-dependent protease HslVU (ClpYQ) peptidase subunit